MLCCGCSGLLLSFAGDWPGAEPLTSGLVSARFICILLRCLSVPSLLTTCRSLRDSEVLWAASESEEGLTCTRCRACSSAHEKAEKQMLKGYKDKALLSSEDREVC